MVKQGTGEETGAEVKCQWLTEQMKNSLLLVLLPSLSRRMMLTVELMISGVSKLWPVGHILPAAYFCK